MQRPLKQSDPRATFRRVYFTCVDTAALQTRLQSSDMSTFVAYLTKNGASPALLSSPTITQVDATNAKGLFYIELTAGNCDTIGTLVLVITNTGGTKTMEKREISMSVDQAYFATVQAGTLTAGAFTTDRTEATNYWKNCMLIGVTGANSGAGGKKVDAFATAGGLFTLATGVTLPATPVAGDIFELVNR